MRNKKGITLIALVITITVLLVLAGVSLSLVLGENGILKKSQKATTETRKAEEKEKIEMAVAAARAAGNGVLTAENLNTELNKINSTGILRDEKEKWWSYNYSADKKYTIYKTGEVKEQTSLLPIEYQQLEYIESTGTQYIDTGIQLNNNSFSAEVAFQATRNLSENWIFAVWYRSGWRAGQSQPNVFDKNYGFTYSQVQTFDDYTIATSEQNTTKNIPITVQIFGQKDESNLQRFGYYKLYYCIVYSNKKEIKNFIPCYSTTTVTDVNGKQCPAETKGLYDLVEGEFYTNQGSGDDFKAGPNV